MAAMKFLGVQIKMFLAGGPRNRTKVFAFGERYSTIELVPYVITRLCGIVILKLC